MPRRMNSIISAILILMFGCFPSVTLAVEPKGKPRLPIEVNIAPSQAGTIRQSIKPGDVIDLKISGKSPVHSGEMTIEAELMDGAELVSGDLLWTGPVGRGEEKNLIISVRAPQAGVGMVKARVTISKNGKTILKREFRYALGPDLDQKTAPSYKLKKDSKGRSIVEY